MKRNGKRNGTNNFILARGRNGDSIYCNLGSTRVMEVLLSITWIAIAITWGMVAITWVVIAAILKRGQK